MSGAFYVDNSIQLYLFRSDLSGIEVSYAWIDCRYFFAFGFYSIDPVGAGQLFLSYMAPDSMLQEAVIPGE